MKRLVSELLIWMLLLSGIWIPQVSAAAEEQDTENQAQLLIRLGVLDAELLAKEGQTITRGQFCRIAMRMLGYPEEAVSSAEVQLFEDVPRDHDAAGAIHLAYSKGIMTGSGARLFQPEDAVTYEQALKIMVGVLGWIKFAETEDIMAWSVSRATKLGITKGISLSLTDPLTKDAMITLLYQSLECDALTVETLGNNKTITKTSNLLYASFRAVKASGIVTANALTGLKGEGTDRRDEIAIDGRRYFCGNLDAGQYLGYQVIFYYTENQKSEKPQLLMIWNGDTKVTEINARDLESFRDGQYTYVKENGTSASIRVPQSADLIYNGKSPTHASEAMYLPETGRVRILSRGSRGSADVVFVEEYENLFVSNINQQDKILYDKYDSSKRLNLGAKPQTECDILYDNGETADFSAMKTDTLLSVMKSDDESYIKIVINSGKQTGTISALYQDTLELDGVKYRIAKSYNTALQPKLSSGEKGTVFLDRNGEVAVFIPETFETYQYGYLMDACVMGVFGSVRVKLLTVQGEVREYPVKLPLTIDAAKVREAQEVVDKLSNASGVEQQMIRYTLNAEQEVNQIDLAYTTAPQPEEKKNSLHLEYSSGAAGYEYKSYAGTFSGKVNIDDATVIFSVPEEKMADDAMYTIETKSYFINDESYRIKSYIIEPDTVIADAVVVIKGDDDAISDTNSLGLVGSIYQGLSKDNNACEMISVLHEGVQKELTFADPEILKRARIEEGDVIRFALNNKGEINILEKTYDLSADVMVNSESHNNRLYNAKFKLIQCGLYQKTGKVLVVGAADKVGSGTKGDYTKYTLVSMSHIYVYEKNARDGSKAYIGSEKDLLDYLHVGGDFSKLFIRSEYAQPRDVIVYK